MEGRHLLFGDRKAVEGQGAAASVNLTAYGITNQESRTLFPGESYSTTRPVSILQFDRFQENLLRNYAFYCEAMAATAKGDSAKRPTRINRGD